MRHPRQFLPEHCRPRVKPPREITRPAAYLDGNGGHLVGQVLVQQADGCGQELQRAGVCLVGIDAIQQLKVHDEDVPLLQEARGNMSKPVSAGVGPWHEAQREGHAAEEAPAAQRTELRSCSSLVSPLEG